MAEFSLEEPFDQLVGKLKKDSNIIYRRTRRYDARGHVVLEEKHAYAVGERDFKKKPPRGNEKRNMELMKKAQRLTNQYLSSDSADLTALRERFEKQLATGKPDPEVPILKKTGKQKIYTQFDRFVYALIYNRLKQQPDNNE